MLNIPFPVETLPCKDADLGLVYFRRDRPGVVPVLVGDADVFSAEWAECVDEFVAPEVLIERAEAVDLDDWFGDHMEATLRADAHIGKSMAVWNLAYRAVALPVDLLLLPVRLASWPFRKSRPQFFSRSPLDVVDEQIEVATPIRISAPEREITRLRSQLSELEEAGNTAEDMLAEVRAVLDEIEQSGNCDALYPDPVAYVAPRDGLASAGLLNVAAPWEAAAWLQHAAYSHAAPQEVFIAFCHWLWDRHEAQIITASSDHMGFELARPIRNLAEADAVLRRFIALGAMEVNAETAETDGASLVGAKRIWVWWD